MIRKFLPITVAVLLASAGIVAQSQETKKPAPNHPCDPCELPEEALIPAGHKNGKYGFVNKRGEFVIAPQFADVWNFSEGLAAVRVGRTRSGKWGYITKRAK